MNTNLRAPGVYRIHNLQTGFSYIGESHWIASRINMHLQSLRTEKHSLAPLQSDWLAYGVDAFAFEALRTVSEYRARLYWEAYFMVYGGFVLYNCERDITDRHRMVARSEYRRYVNI